MEKVFRKSLLNKSKVEYADFAINHVEGCAHGCKYPCYAMNMAKRIGWVKTDDDWCKPKIVANAITLLDKEIPKYKDIIKFVYLSFMTDPFMVGYDDFSELSLKIINKLNSAGIKVTTLTKGVYPKELKGKAYSKDNEYGITLVSLSNDHHDRFEPFSAPYAERIKSLRYLSEAGLKTWVSIEPYPTPNIFKQKLS
jgi:DNA repair photolyase